MSKIKVVHYLNQFFAGIGGEEKADYKPEVRTGVVGPGMALNKEFGDEAEIVATVICGDSYFNENLKEAQETILKMVCLFQRVQKVHWRDQDLLNLNSAECLPEATAFEPLP